MTDNCIVCLEGTDFVVPLATSYVADLADKETLAEILSYLIRPISVSIEDGFLCLNCFNRIKDAYNITLLATNSRCKLVLMHEKEKIEEDKLRTICIEDCQDNENQLEIKETEYSTSDEEMLTKSKEVTVQEPDIFHDISDEKEINTEENDTNESALCNESKNNEDDDSDEYEFFVLDEPKPEVEASCEPETATKPERKLKKIANFECLKCNKKFTFRENLRRHMKLHSSKSIFDCSICKSKSFSTKLLLYNHLYKEHQFPAPFSCLNCNAGFTYFSQLKIHKIATRCKEVGETIVDFVCKFCSRSFANAGNLRRHLMIHTNERPFECTICSKTFNQKQTMIIHERTHTKNTPLHCTKCPKQFSDPSFFKKHLKSHIKNETNKNDEQ